MIRRYTSTKALLLAITAALSIGVVSACQNPARGGEQDRTGAEASTSAEGTRTREAARGFANDAAQVARTVGSLAADAGEQVARRASALTENVDVKAALMADAAVDAGRIDVDVSAWTRTITLNGSVATAGARPRPSHAPGPTATKSSTISRSCYGNSASRFT